jgi:hypothetical protein
VEHCLHVRLQRERRRRLRDPVHDVRYPSRLVPPCLGISTALTGPGKYDPDAIRFHNPKRLSCSPSSNRSTVTPSAPAAPPFFLTFSHASHTNRLGMSYDLP